MLTAWQCFNKQFRRDWLLNMRQPRLLINAALFFVMIVVFFPLTMPPNMDILRQVIPGVIWIAVLLAMLLAADRLFLQDYEEGIIEQWLISGYSTSLIVTAKLAVHWLLTLLPLLLFCPFLALFFHFSWLELIVLMLSLIAGTPAILALCSLAAAFSVGLQQKGIFMALILLPLTLPIMIFGSSSLAVMEFSQVTGNLAMLLAFSLLCVCFLPFAIAAIIRISLIG
ncbi:heme exporter protein CcmB [Legionella beliardensis]|uniref:Heme exporter protein B n=1 Tax=Legionella beliardensis TaxID=91822 RepID=A0A378HZN7_9GAMM|nr:heme exporter protein CcmB [Legionella beliardensis]STX28389.1 heme exporter protein CcmB [Legionella beliardensis]